MTAAGGKRSRATLLGVLTIGLTAVAGGSVVASAEPPCPNSQFRVGSSEGLPDCRAYEQASPVDKEGFAAYPVQIPPAEVSPSGEKVMYHNYQAFPGAVGNTAVSAAHVSTRSNAGWQGAEWTPPVPKAETMRLYEVEYFFSRDLLQAALQIPLIPLVAGATPFASNLFLRDAQGAYSLVNTAKPAVSVEELAVSDEEVCGLTELAECYPFFDRSAYAGASGDFKHLLFESNGKLTANAPETLVESLYENVNGHVQLVGILPDGTSAAQSTLGAGSSSANGDSTKREDRSVERAVSEDGSHVIFEGPADEGQPDSAQNGLMEVYDRVNGSETIDLSAPAPGAEPSKCEVKTGTCSAESATFQTASRDGSRVFFTSSAELTTTSNTGPANEGEDLYEYDFAKPPAERLVDITAETTDPTGTQVLGVVDASTDGSFVYFVARGQLAEGKGIDGQPNLYMAHEGDKPVFIATLSAEGSCHLGVGNSADSCVWTPFPAEREAYVTADGRHLAFMSTKQLPTVNFPAGYDSVDQETGNPDAQVYEYTAPARAEGTGQLVCASCDPTGARPVGNALLGGISNAAVAGQYGTVNTPFYRTRAMSENGARLFYAAPASLGTSFTSVYEFEQNGEGGCQGAAGCQYRISSGALEQNDDFLGASETGADVFFATREQLVSTDTDHLSDVYDARVGGGFAPPPEESKCEVGCQTPSPPSGVAPAIESATTAPSGNLPAPLQNPARSKANPRSASQIKAEKLAKAIRRCKKGRSKKTRISCEKRARHLYGKAKS